MCVCVCVCVATTPSCHAGGQWVFIVDSLCVHCVSVVCAHTLVMPCLYKRMCTSTSHPLFRPGQESMCQEHSQCYIHVVMCTYINHGDHSVCVCVCVCVCALFDRFYYPSLCYGIC